MTPEPQIPSTPAQIASLLHRFFTFYKRWKMDAIPSTTECTTHQLTTLLMIRKGGPIRMGTIAGMLGLSRSAVTLLVDTMQQEGLVARQPDPEDRRSMLVALTEDGAESACTHGARFDAEIATLIDVLEPEERTELLRLLTKLLTTHEAPDEAPCCP